MDVVVCLYVWKSVCVWVREEEDVGRRGSRQANLSSTEPTSKLCRANNLPNWIQSRLTAGGTEASGSIQYEEGCLEVVAVERSVCVCVMMGWKGEGWYGKWHRKGKEDNYKKQRANTRAAGDNNGKQTGRGDRSPAQGRFWWLRVSSEGVRGSNRLEVWRNGSQLCFCMITPKTSFASGNEIQARSVDTYGYRPKEKKRKKTPSSPPPAQIRGLTVVSHRFAYEDEHLSWIIFINILLRTEYKPNWPTWMLFITVLCWVGLVVYGLQT